MSHFSRKKPVPLLYVDGSEQEHLLLHRAAASLKAQLQIWSVTTPEAAIQSLQGESKDSLRRHSGMPALILLDYQLAGSTALDLLSWIRARSQFDPVPVVMYGGSDDQDQMHRCYQFGADAFLCKPTHFGRIEEIVSSLVRCLSSHPIDLDPLRFLPEHRPISECVLRPPSTAVLSRATPQFLSVSWAGNKLDSGRKTSRGLGQSRRFRIWQRYRSSRREIGE